MPSKFGLDVVVDAKDIILDGTQTTAILKVNGRTVGVTLSEQGNHAEVNALNLLTEWQNGKLGPGQMGVMSQAPIGGGSHFIDIFLTRSPCEACTKAILAWANGLRSNANLRLRLFCATIYKGEHSAASISDIKSLRAHQRIEVWRWDLVGMGAAHDQDSRTVLQVANGISLFELNAGAFNATDWPSRLGAPNTTDLPILQRSDPNNFYVTS